MRRGMVSALALSIALPGCAGPSRGPGSIAAGPNPDFACAEGMALPAALREKGSILLFGEIHGARELPAHFGEAVCATAAAGLPVEVGLEIPRQEQGSLDLFLASAGAPSDVEALLATPFWSRDYRDGRSSEARVALLERLRRLRALGLPIDVFLFDIDTGQDAAAREALMADNIAARARAHPGALAMVLVGEVHAWKRPGAPWDSGFLPMGWRLEQAGLSVRSLGRSTPEGVVWICTGGSSASCGPGKARATDPLPGGGASGIELLSSPSARGYDGLYGTPSLTPSPPAKPAHQTKG